MEKKIKIGGARPLFPLKSGATIFPTPYPNKTMDFIYKTYWKNELNIHEKKFKQKNFIFIFEKGLSHQKEVLHDEKKIDC